MSNNADPVEVPAQQQQPNAGDVPKTNTYKKLSTQKKDLKVAQYFRMLPPVTGFNNHDYTRERRPAYSISDRRRPPDNSFVQPRFHYAKGHKPINTHTYNQSNCQQQNGNPQTPSIADQYCEQTRSCKVVTVCNCKKISIS